MDPHALSMLLTTATTQHEPDTCMDGTLKLFPHSHRQPRPQLQPQPHPCLQSYPPTHPPTPDPTPAPTHHTHLDAGHTGRVIPTSCPEHMLGADPHGAQPMKDRDGEPRPFADRGVNVQRVVVAAQPDRPPNKVHSSNGSRSAAASTHSHCPCSGLGVTCVM
jgi:hypothetical protein